MEYTEVKIRLDFDSENREIITALLAEIGFESFTEDQDFLMGYIPSKMLNTNEIEEVFTAVFETEKPEYTIESIAEQNWNAVWESNYSPVIIDEKVSIRAPFHEAPTDIEYEIIIEPKMSFGTAHHPTTAQIISLMLNMDFENKIVMDMGCGTSVLAILAAMKGAKHVDAVDNDDWAVNNSIENISKNHLQNIEVFLDDAKFLNSSKTCYYQIFIANINRNILLNDMELYEKSIVKGGHLLMSGFYDDDLSMINAKAEELGMKFLEKRVNNNWCAAVWIKQ